MDSAARILSLCLTELEWSLTLRQLVVVCSVVVIGQDKLAMMCGDGSNKIVGRESFKV